MLAAALATMLGGCGGGDAPPADAGLTVYVSVPLRGPSAVDGRDIVRGAKLALDDAGGAVGEVEVRGVYLDDTAGRGPSLGWDPAQVAENARRATEDSTAIAYIGELESGATRTSLPITNKAQLLHISPASGADDLVEPFTGSGDVPTDAQPSGIRTFGRVIPSDSAQAAAAASWARGLGARRVGTLSDGTRASDLAVSEFAQVAADSGLAVVVRAAVGPREDDERRLDRLDRARLQSIFYGGIFRPDEPTQGPIPTLGAPIKLLLDPPQPGGFMIGTDALLTLANLRAVRGPTAYAPEARLYLTSAALDTSQLPAEGQRMVTTLRRRYGAPPGRYAAYGYEAMAVVLDSIERAGERGTEREAVLAEFLAAAERDSLLGTYSIDEVGNTTLDRLAGYRLAGDGRVTFDRPLRAR